MFTFKTRPIAFILIGIFTLCTVNFKTIAQDAQYSQFYSAPLNLNPALTGASGSTRFGVNYRNQWPQLNANFITTSFYVDHFFDRANSGVGLVINRDQETLANLRSLSAGLSYSYLFRTSENLNFRLGVSGAFVNRAFDFSGLVFGDQFDGNGLVISETTAERLDANQVNYADLNAGFMAYTKKLYFGFAASHITQPNRAFIENVNNVLPIKYSVHAGYQINLPGRKFTDSQIPRRKERHITPALQYKMQGQFSQLDFGIYTTLDPIVFAVSYRGLPINGVENVVNNESIIFLAGVSLPNIKFGYSFDYTLSRLGISSGGAHEISIAYILKRYKGRRKPPRDVQLIPCPKF